MISESDKIKYLQGFEELTENEKWIYVEGKSNGVFYKRYSEFGRLPIKSGGSCSNIIALVKNNKNRFGIIDNDYRLNFNIDRVYTVNFYSIENISLLFCPILEGLRQEIQKFAFKYDFESLRKGKLSSDISRSLDYRPLEYSISLSGFENEPEILHYLENKIQCIEDVYRYKRLKSEVEKYVVFLKETRGKGFIKQFEFCYLIDLLPSKELYFIFERNVFERLQSDLLVYNN